MSELTYDECNDPSILDSSRWLVLRGDAYVFLDPATGYELRKDQPHVWVRDSPLLQQGFDQFPAARAEGHKLILAYGGHASANNLDMPAANDEGLDEQWYETMHTVVGAVALERPGVNRQTVQQQVDAARAEPAEPQQFVDRQHRALAAHGSPFLLPDTPGGTDVPLDALLLELNNIQAGRLSRRTPVYDLLPKRREVFLPMQHMREWALVGRYMLEATSQAEAMAGNNTVLFPAGSEHQDLARKFRLCGLEVHEVNLLTSAARRATSWLRSQALAQCKVSVGVMAAKSNELALTATRTSGFQAGVGLRQIHTR